MLGLRNGFKSCRPLVSQCLIVFQHLYAFKASILKPLSPFRIRARGVFICLSLVSSLNSYAAEMLSLQEQSVLSYLANHPTERLLVTSAAQIDYAGRYFAIQLGHGQPSLDRIAIFDKTLLRLHTNRSSLSLSGAKNPIDKNQRDFYFRDLVSMIDYSNLVRRAGPGKKYILFTSLDCSFCSRLEKNIESGAAHKSEDLLVVPVYLSQHPGSVADICKRVESGWFGGSSKMRNCGQRDVLVWMGIFLAHQVPGTPFLIRK